MIDPYYNEGGTQIFNADARDVVPSLSFTNLVLITDPPYGVELGVGKDMRGGSHGLAKRAYDIYQDTYENFVGTVVPVLHQALSVCCRGAVFCGPHLVEMPKPDALGAVYCKAATGRHKWGFNTLLPFYLYGTDPELHKGARPTVLESSAIAGGSDHPCPKPLQWMTWLISRVAVPGDVILDPFMGRGTTLVAAQKLGFPAVGIEISKAYCESAVERLRQRSLLAACAD